MDKIILVGGLQYSGKSTLCERLDRDPAGYKHVEFDRLFNEVAICGGPFFKYLRMHNEESYNLYKRVAIGCGLHDPTEQLQGIGQVMIKNGLVSDWLSLLHSVCAYYTADLLMKSNGNTPVLEGLFINRDERIASYNLLNECLDKMGKGGDYLKFVQKFMIYFNLGLDLSLQRLRENPQHKYEALMTTEEVVRNTAARIEVPSKDELPNLEVVVVSSIGEIDEAARLALK
jgi:hypothetical protein